MSRLPRESLPITLTVLTIVTFRQFWMAHYSLFCLWNWESPYISSKFNPLNTDTPLKRTVSMAPSVSILTGFDRKYNETYDTIFELDKIWGREEDHKKGNEGVSLHIAPDNRRFVNVSMNLRWRVFIKQKICNNMCLYIRTQSLNK